MISSGEWNKNNVTKYLYCDDYNGDNTPKRYGLMLNKAFTSVSGINVVPL